MKKLIRIYGSLLQHLMEHVFGAILVITGIWLCFVMWLQIFARTFTDVPPSWTEEISRLTFIWFGILASCYTLWKKQHMRVDILYIYFNPTVKRVVRALGQICIMILGFILLKEGLGLLKIFSIQLTSILRWPMTIFYTVMPVSGFLYLVIGLYEFIKIIWADELNQTEQEPSAG